MNIAEEQANLRRSLESRGITDPRVLDAIEHTRRDLFVPPDQKPYAYVDNALPIGEGQTISQPFIVALMTQALELQGDERVLEVGTGSGYQAAVLARLCREVVTIERLESLSQSAQRALAEAGCTNIDFRVGDGTLGCADKAPYDGIIVTAAPPDVPEPLFEQLADGGRLVVPIGDVHAQELVVVRKRGDSRTTRVLCQCRFVKLIGEAGW